ncbi:MULTISPECIES: SRPBCC family protein [unclassified Leptolyngbya]|uniref:SRPBCC family protein n=1 Tax=unclassified Leptolyngbya TaxID=2650499 RepID=UPI0016856991|nr:MULTISPECIES: SRPBCC family protein [unclassified Leptolyngbya]MBD1910332.1 cyclase [Leptolyngbya sp. FACHB-8]MBD2154865.1 cyclase [Leptolyngbya sp. FACHB-16]
MSETEFPVANRPEEPTYECEASDLDGDELSREVAVHTEQLEGRRRRISAELPLPYSCQQLWQILTDYDHLADFIPSLTKSQRIDHPSGGIRVEQVGAETFLRLKVCLRVVLDMVESFPNEIQFSMVEGDLRQFTGAWQLTPQPEARGTVLRYVVTVQPGRAIPISIIERNLRHNLVRNLLAIRQRADVLFNNSL